MLLADEEPAEARRWYEQAAAGGHTGAMTKPRRAAGGGESGRRPHLVRAGRLVHTDHVFINFANRTYQWVDIQSFRLPEAVDEDAVLLAALIEHERFGNDYATRPGDDPERHGPYWRDRITPDCYDLIDAKVAERHLRSWAEQLTPVPEHLRPELQREVYQSLRAAGRVYQLRYLGRAAFHDWGGVHNKFHEFVFMDRASRTLTLVVAADD